MPNYAPRDEGIMRRALQQQGAGQQYQQMPTQGRLGMLQGAMKGGQQPSEQDMEILRRLRGLVEEEDRSQKIAPGYSGTLTSGRTPGPLSRLWETLGLGAVHKANPFGIVSDELQRANTSR